MVQYAYITKDYYKDHPDLVKILDIDDSGKHDLRTHLCLSIQYDGHNVLIPLRKNLGEPDRKFGKIGFSVPSRSKPDAGLDYRYIMIINDPKYIRFDIARIPNKQQNIIKNNYATIEKEALDYIKAYIKAAEKKRVEKTARFRESSLINFHSELNIAE